MIYHFTAIVLFGVSHLAVLGAILGTAAALVLVARPARSGKTKRRAAVALAVLLLFNKIAVLCTAYKTGGFDFQNALPMHLCDWASIAAMIALAWKSQLAFEMTYFWGLGGTLQALITPDLAYDFPDVRFLTFFISHGGIIVAIAFLTLVMGMRPWPSSLVRIFLWSNVYLAVAGLLDFLVGANYGYLCHKPLHPSLLDKLGPWPFYIFSLETIALVSFAIYYAPFFAMDWIGSRRTTPETVDVTRSKGEAFVQALDSL